MKIDVAMQLVAALELAIERARHEGRDELLASDLDVFAAADDAARDELAAAIVRAGS